MIGRCDEEIATKREGLWARAHPRWEEREAYERAKMRNEVFLKELKKEPATHGLTSKVSCAMMIVSRPQLLTRHRNYCSCGPQLVQQWHKALERSWKS